MFWQRNIHEVMFNFVEESKLFCNRRCFNVCQPSLCCRCVTLVVHHWSLRTNHASVTLPGVLRM